MSHARPLIANALTGLLILVAASSNADELKTINNPGGGQIVYGALTGATSLQSGMSLALRKIHSSFGDRPQIGQFFQTDSNSVATFFTVNGRTRSGEPKQFAGLVIVSMPPGSEPAGAALFDDSARFAKTGPMMMRTLNKAWRSSSAAPGRAHASAASGEAQPLRMVTGGDRSASIGLPAGWQIINVAGGQLVAKGPNDEQVFLGLIYQQINEPGMRSFGARGPGLVFPRNGDLFSAYVSLTNQVRRSKGLSQASFKLVSSQNLPPNQNEQRVIQVIVEIDLHDGRGIRKGSARVGAMYVRGLPTWAMTISSSNMPETVADAEASTLTAILRSYTQDSRVIAQETNAVIDRIHATARAAQIRADAQSAVNDSRNRAFDQHMDDIDRYSKSFQNYQFDRSQVHDSERNERGTVSNGAADALVHADPNRFQIVRTQDFVRGVDY